MPDYIPQSDPEFNVWQGNMMSIVEPSLENWGINTSDFESLQTRQTNWTGAFAKASNKQNRTSADVQAKDDSRTAYEKDIRLFVAQWLANNSRVPNSERERMGLTVKAETRRPSGIPASRPLGSVDFSVRMQHSLQFVDEQTPRSKGKPSGVHGCEIWIKLGGEAPKDADELIFKATSTRSPYTLTFEGEDVGKTAWYWLRWVNKRGQPGPWSSALSAMVAG